VARRASAVALWPLLAAVGLVACSATDSSAEREIQRKAEGVGLHVGHVGARSATEIARVANGFGNGEVQTLQARGDKYAKGGAEIVIRVTVESTDMYGQPTGPVSRCFRLAFRNRTGDGVPARVRCPDVPPLAVPPAPPVSTVPSNAEESLRKALGGLPAGRRGDLGAVRAAASSSVRGPGIDPQVAAGDGWVGVAIAVGDDCLMGRVRPGRVEVWTPPAITVAPGELTCTPDVAAAGLAQHSPH
jgi:hypothetical protein